jgi:hypothetical protein
VNAGYAGKVKNLRKLYKKTSLRRGFLLPGENLWLASPWVLNNRPDCKSWWICSGMDKAERSSQKWRDQVKKDAKEVSASIIAVGAAAAIAAVGVGAAGLAIVKNTAQQVTEADRWAKSLKCPPRICYPGNLQLNKLV